VDGTGQVSGKPLAHLSWEDERGWGEGPGAFTRPRVHTRGYQVPTLRGGDFPPSGPWSPEGEIG
jgi:hypothetical protein